MNLFLSDFIFYTVSTIQTRESTLKYLSMFSTKEFTAHSTVYHSWDILHLLLSTDRT